MYKVFKEIKDHSYIYTTLMHLASQNWKFYVHTIYNTQINFVSLSVKYNTLVTSYIKAVTSGMTTHLSKYTINYLYGMFIRQQDTLSCYIWYQHIIIQLVSYSYLLEIYDKCTGHNSCL